MNKRDNRPIGIFDSGVGGLTVFRAIGRRLPGESLLYFGDTAHLPYGSKSPEAVTRFSLEVARFLKGRGIKAALITDGRFSGGTRGLCIGHISPVEVLLAREFAR